MHRLVRKLVALLFGATFAGVIVPPVLYVHNVFYAPGNPMFLTYGGRDGTITIEPFPRESCVVTASATAAINSKLLVDVTPPSGTAVMVVLAIHVLRAPIGSSETVRVSGEWHATGEPAMMGCNSSGTIAVDVKVIPALNQGPATTANLPGSGFAGDPIATATGEVTQFERDLDLGGPLPLRFVRYYASLLKSNGVRSAIGNNWMHNFDLKLAVSGGAATVTLFRGQTVAHFRVLTYLRSQS